MTLDRCLKGRFVVVEDVKIEDGSEIHDYSVIKHCTIGKNTKIWNFVNLFNCTIGNDNVIGSFTEIGNAKIGDFCKIETGTFIPKGVTIGNRVFIGPNVTFTNDIFPKSTGNWSITPTIIEDDVSIGANCTILPGITLGEGCLIAAGSTVTRSVKPFTLVMGKKAKPKRKLKH